MDMQELRQEICRVARSLFERGYVHATAGNISVRLDEAQGGGFLITPTDACLGFLQPEALAWVDDAGTQRGGERASKALALHQRIYAADAAARCILHTHSTHLVALSLQGVWQPQAVLPPITPYYVMKVGKVPHIPYHRPGDPQAAQAVEQAMEQAASRQAPIRGVLLERLGPTVWHTSLAAAMAVLEELEETARLWLTVQPRPEPLSDAQIDELRQQFGATW